MKLPFTFKKDEDIPAIKWLIKATLVYIFLAAVLYDARWFQAEIVAPYAKVVAWELEKLLSILAFDVSLSQDILFIKGLPYAIRISPNCAGLWGGFFVFIAVISTLPAPSFRRRFLWIVVGVFILTSTNLIRIIIVIAMCLMDPTQFYFFHTISKEINIFVGGVLSLLATRSLFLRPRRIRAFRSSDSRDPR